MRRLHDYSEDGDTVVMWRINRLGRSVLEVVATVNLPRKRGADVRSASDNIGRRSEGIGFRVRESVADGAGPGHGEPIEAHVEILPWGSTVSAQSRALSV